jgi:hypothetical protein
LKMSHWNYGHEEATKYEHYNFIFLLLLL